MINLDSECIILATNPTKRWKGEMMSLYSQCLPGVSDSFSNQRLGWLGSRGLPSDLQISGLLGNKTNIISLQKPTKTESWEDTHFSFSSDFCCLNPSTSKGRSMSNPHNPRLICKPGKPGTLDSASRVMRFKWIGSEVTKKNNQPAFYPSKSIKILDLSWFIQVLSLLTPWFIWIKSILQRNFTRTSGSFILDENKTALSMQLKQRNKSCVVEFPQDQKTRDLPYHMSII